MEGAEALRLAIRIHKSSRCKSQLGTSSEEERVRNRSRSKERRHEPR